jgi:hypothetical protein
MSLVSLSLHEGNRPVPARYREGRTPDVAVRGKGDVAARPLRTLTGRVPQAT